MHQPHLGSVRVQGCACGAVAWLSDGEVAILVERNRYWLPKGRQHLSLDIEADHVGPARADVSHGISGGGGICDVGHASFGIGQQAAHKRRVVRCN